MDQSTSNENTKQSHLFTSVSSESSVAKIQNKPNFLPFHLKNTDSRKNKPNSNPICFVAQSPSAVVIHPSPKGCPYFCLFHFTFLLFVKSNPNVHFSAKNEDFGIMTYNVPICEVQQGFCLQIRRG